MARHIESTLYRYLMDHEFRFMERGLRTINEIYDTVEYHFPLICDNNYLCSQNCRAGNNQPEWKHTVRNALQALKSAEGPVIFTGTRGLWLFT